MDQFATRAGIALIAGIIFGTLAAATNSGDFGFLIASMLAGASVVLVRPRGEPKVKPRPESIPLRAQLR